MWVLADHVTQRIGLGPHPSREGAIALRESGYRVAFNVGTASSELYEGVFDVVVADPIEDLVPIPPSVAIRLTNTLHMLLSSYPGKVYIHCVAGLNRSATVLWLYFLTLGLSPHQAEDLIARARMDAVPGHPRLAPPELVAQVSTLRREVDPHALMGILALV